MTMPVVPASATPEFPLPKALVWAICLMFSPLAGAILYYLWRRRHPEAAAYANRVSWVSFGVWMAVIAAKRVLSGEPLK